MRASCWVLMLLVGCGTGGDGTGGGGTGGGSGGGAGGSGVGGGTGGGIGGGTGGGTAGGAGGGAGGGTAGGAGGGSGGGVGGAGGGAGGGTAGGGVGAGGGSGGGAGGGIPFEQEPNNGAATGQLDSLGAPGAKQGAVGAANDLDIFMVALTAGQQWRWSLDAQGSQLAPHLSLTEAQNAVPALVARGAVGGSVAIDQLVLKTGNYAVIVRDSRNVPSSSSQNVGSAQHSYVVSTAASTRAPIAVTVPSTTNGTLASRYASALYQFTLATQTPVTINVLAKTKAPASDLDSRLTLFNGGTSQWFGTNDDSGSTTDSKLTGTLAAGSYLVVVDNVSETANDLTFQLAITSP